MKVSFTEDGLDRAFYRTIRAALEQFAKTKENHKIYALVFDCDSSVGQIVLRYQSEENFQNSLKEYKGEEERQLYGMHGLEYEVGEFKSITYDPLPMLAWFTDSYYYYKTEEYYGEGGPIPGLEDRYQEIFWDLLYRNCERFAKELKEIGIDTTEDVIFFCCDHDQSESELDLMIRQTVDSALVKRLILKGAK